MPSQIVKRQHASAWIAMAKSCDAACISMDFVVDMAAPRRWCQAPAHSVLEHSSLYRFHKHGLNQLLLGSIMVTVTVTVV